MPVYPDLHLLAVFPSAEEPARPDVSHLLGFFDSLQGRRDGVHGAPPEGPSDTALPDVSDGLDDRRQDQGAPTSPYTPPWPYSPETLTAGPQPAPA